MAKKKSKRTKGKQDEAIQIQILWGSTEALETIYVNHMTITHSGPEFYLVFGELPMPAILDKSAVPKELEIIPKVRLAISSNAMRAIAGIIRDNLEKFSEEAK